MKILNRIHNFLSLCSTVWYLIYEGTTNAFSTYGDKIHDDLNLNDYFMSASSSLGVLGLNFVVPAG